MENLFITKVGYEQLEDLRSFFNDHQIVIEEEKIIDFITTNEVTLIIKAGVIVNAQIINLENEIRSVTDQYLDALESNV